MAAPSDDPQRPSGLDIVAEMRAWRAAHPHATLLDIETALNERLMALRTNVLAETVAQSPLSDWADAPRAQRPACPECGATLQPKGKRKRRLRTQGGEVALDRTYGICPVCGAGVFPPG